MNLTRRGFLLSTTSFGLLSLGVLKVGGTDFVEYAYTADFRIVCTPTLEEIILDVGARFGLDPSDIDTTELKELYIRS